MRRKRTKCKALTFYRLAPCVSTFLNGRERAGKRETLVTSWLGSLFPALCPVLILLFHASQSWLIKASHFLHKVYISRWHAWCSECSSNHASANNQETRCLWLKRERNVTFACVRGTVDILRGCFRLTGRTLLLRSLSSIKNRLLNIVIGVYLIKQSENGSVNVIYQWHICLH